MKWPLGRQYGAREALFVPIVFGIALWVPFSRRSIRFRSGGAPRFRSTPAQAMRMSFRVHLVHEMTEKRVQTVHEMT